MKDILAPTIASAREGFPVSELIAHYWALGGKIRKDYPGFAETFLPAGRAPRKGEIFRNPNLAETLERIAAGGRDEFYKGALADTMEAFCLRVGCFLRKRPTSPSTPPPGWSHSRPAIAGTTCGSCRPTGRVSPPCKCLNVLEGFDLRSMGHNSAAYLHHLIEAKKLAYEDRARLYADPDFATVPLATLSFKGVRGPTTRAA